MSPVKTLLLAALLPLLAQATPLRRATPQLIHPNGDKTKCLSVVNPTNDAPVQSLSCDLPQPNQYTAWTIAPGDNTVVQLTGTNYCLDAGSTPQDNTPAKVYTCFPGLGQQHWYYTEDEHIAITGGTQCLDSAFSSGGSPQTYTCTGGNTNQVWGTSDTSAPVTYTPPPSTIITSSAATGTTSDTVITTSASVTATVTATTPAPTSTPFYAPSNGTQLYYNGNTQQCLTVRDGYAAQGTSVAVVECFSAVDPAIALQLWTLTRNAAGKIQLTLPQHGTDYCLDFGSAPADGGVAKIWDCLDVPQQTFWYTTDNRVALYNGNQCLDVVSGSGPTQEKPYGTLQDVQSWECTTGDVQQIWTSSLAQ